jgi:hypothetical protein
MALLLFRGSSDRLATHTVRKFLLCKQVPATGSGHISRVKFIEGDHARAVRVPASMPRNELFDCSASQTVATPFSGDYSIDFGKSGVSKLNEWLRSNHHYETLCQVLSLF